MDSISRCAVEPLESRQLLTAAPVLVGDLNQSTDQVGPDNVLPVGPISYFTGHPTEADGPELFKTDGTAAGTVLVRDINPKAGSEPELLTNVNGTIFFVADDGTSGRELWKTDGTAAGTTIVADLKAGVGASNPANLTNVDGTLYFTADDGTGPTLYKTDGTVAGTTKVRLVNGISTLYRPANLVAYNGKLLLTADNASSGQIYSVTGTTAALVTSTPTNARGLFVFNGAVYFTISENNSPTVRSRGDLWKTDGTAAGTALVTAIDNASSSTDFASTSGFTVSGDRFYFYTGSVISGLYSIWVSDGTAAGTRSFVLANSNVDPNRKLTPIGTRSVVYDLPNTSSQVIWVSDGTLAGTRQLKSFPSTSTGSVTGHVPLANGRLLFTASATYGGSTQIYTTDGTAAGTVTLTSVDVPGLLYPVGTVNGRALLSSTRRLNDGEVFVSDGTAAGTARIGAVVPGNGSGLSDFPVQPLNKQFFAVGDTVYFSATDGKTGFELYKSVNRGAPVRVADLNPGAGDSGPDSFVLGTDGSLFFTTGQVGDGSRQLMRMGTDGVIAQLASGTSTYTDLTPIAGQLYFKVSNTLWRWAPGETAAAVTVGGQTIGAVGRLVRAGNAWYFGGKPYSGTSLTNVQRLYRIDNTGSARPAEVTTISSGDSYAYPPEPIGAAGNTLMFGVYTSTNGGELWKTDGTALGTQFVADLTPGAASTDFDTFQPDFSLSVGNVLYFGADSDNGYSDLYRTDGTAAGTVKLAENKAARQFTVANGNIYFVANVDESYGNSAPTAIYRVDGDTITQLSTPGTGDAAFHPVSLLAAGDNLFTVGRGGDGARFELWRADAQFNGFARAAVLAPRISIGAASQTLLSFYIAGRSALAATDRDLYFPMYTDALGIEPYRLPLVTTGSVSGVVYNDANATGTKDTGEGAIAGDVLYVDLDGDKAFDTGEPTAVATAAGYTISGVPEGTYEVRRQPTTDGRRQTSPYLNPSLGGGPIGASVNFVAGATISGIDFGTTSLPPTVGSQSYNVDEGRSVTLRGQASEPFGTIAKWEWDLNYDGVTFDVDALGQDVLFSAENLDGNLYHEVALRATDANGLSATRISDVRVNNVRPLAVLLTDDSPVTVGTVWNARFGDPVDVPADLPGIRYSFDFNGDGDFTDAGDVLNSTSPAASYTFAAAGTYTVRARITDKDGGQSDYAVNVVVNAAPTDPASLPLEAEAATLTGGTHFENTNGGFTGTGYADFDASGSAIGFSVPRANAGQVTLTFRYANGGTADRPLAVKVNGASVGSLSFPPTGNWTTWKTVTMNVTLAVGANTIVATAGAASGANLDSLTVTAAVAPPVLGSLSGFCFDDTDKDGVFDSNEKKTGGKIVFIDLDNDGVLDSNEKKTTTATDGSWSFTGLVAGTYRVRRVFPSGYTLSTAPIDVNLAAGQSLTNLAIGSKSGSVMPPANTASIAGSVFNDNNKNGKYDAGDGYAKGVVVFLDTDNDGKLDTGETSVTTDSGGKFGFTKLAAGTYRVRRVMPSGYTYSTTKPDVTLTKGQAKTGVLIGTKKA